MENKYYQYDLFEDNSQEKILATEIDQLSTLISNLRRGLFQRHTEHSRRIETLQEMVNALALEVDLVKAAVTASRDANRC